MWLNKDWNPFWGLYPPQSDKFDREPELATIALDNLVSDLEYTLDCSFVKILSIDGVVDARLNELDGSKITLKRNMTFKGGLQRFFLSWASQAGKEMVILRGFGKYETVRDAQYQIEPDSLRGEDNTNCNNGTSSYVKKKTLQIFGTSQNKPVDKLVYDLDCDTGGVRVAWIKITVESNTQSATQEVEQSQNTTDPIVYEQILTKDYYGTLVEVKVYLKVLGGSDDARNEYLKAYGKTKSKVEYE